MNSYYCAIEALPGLKPAEIKLLKVHGILDTKELISRADTLQKKQALASRLKLKLELVNKWLILADLARVPQINYRYCGLLLHSGITSVSELAQISVGRLHQQVVRLSVATTRSRNLSPSIEIVKQWIEEAKQLETAKVKYKK